MNLFRAMMVSLTRIEDQVPIGKIGPTVGQTRRLIIPMPPKLTMRSCFAKSCGFDIAKCDGRRHAIQPHVPPPLNRWVGATAATTETPRRPGGAGGGEERANQASGLKSAQACSARGKEHFVFLHRHYPV